MKKEKVYFVYLGNQLPYYARSSLCLAKKFSGLDVHLLGDKSQYKQVKGLSISFTPLEDFYEASKFKNASGSITSPAEYRDGFWLKTLERFFVIEQFMSHFDLKKIFHAELDQVLFQVNTLIKNLDLIGKKGIYLPFHSDRVAIASILYCNDLDSMKSLVEFAVTSGKYTNEMELLASWAHAHPDSAFIIPTIRDLVNFSNIQNKKNKISVEDAGGITDAAQIGTWVAGLDPRNVPIFEKPFNKFVDSSELQIATNEQLSKLSFSFNPLNGFFDVHLNNKESVHIFNLHIHSKIHNYINKLGISKLVEIANSDVPVSLWPIRYRQIRFAINSNSLKSLVNPMKIYNFIKVFKNFRS